MKTYTISITAKIIQAVLIGNLALLQPLSAMAVEAPEQPVIEAPAQPSVETPQQPTVIAPDSPIITQPIRPDIQTPESPVVDQPSAPSITSILEATPTRTPRREDRGDNKNNNQQNNQQQTQEQTQQQTVQTDQPTPAPATTAPYNLPDGSTIEGNTNGATATTGDATNSVSAATNANTNAVTAGDTNSGAIVLPGSGSTIQGNSNDDNSSTVNNQSASTTTQTNSANVANNVNQVTNTGNINALRNVGGTSIETGDANTSATIITNVNTNVDGVKIAEFNISDDYMGDYVLDFDANCVAGCGGVPLSAATTGNTNDDNTANITYNDQSGTFQTNDATIDNNIMLVSNSGDNMASRNTMGDTTITTGDANVSANIINMANNNIAGEVILGTVNIYGNLYGDIIFPEELYNAVIASNTTGNANDDNTTNISSTNTDTTTQTNTATINNNITADANTGDNTASMNTGGNTSVTTGDVTIDSQTTNIANNNISGNWFLVLVNEAGNWVGKIFGTDDTGNVASNPQAEYAFDQNGNIIVDTGSNLNTGDNTTNVASNTTSTLEQTNTATINNNIGLYANTGDNTATRNTGSDTTVTTGDATILANIVNLVNNNIAADGRLFVTVVNVFGSWTGDFVMPWAKKPEPQQQAADQQETAANNTSDTQDDHAVGGANNQESGQNGSDNNSSSSSTDDTNNDAVVNTQTYIASLFATRAPAAPGTDSEETEEIAGVFDTVAADIQENESTENERNVTLNLAWLLVALPILGLGLFGKKLLLRQ